MDKVVALMKRGALADGAGFRAGSCSMKESDRFRVLRAHMPISARIQPCVCVCAQWRARRLQSPAWGARMFEPRTKGLNLNAGSDGGAVPILLSPGLVQATGVGRSPPLGRDG